MYSPKTFSRLYVDIFTKLFPNNLWLPNNKLIFQDYIIKNFSFHFSMLKSNGCYCLCDLDFQNPVLKLPKISKFARMNFNYTFILSIIILEVQDNIL